MLLVGMPLCTAEMHVGDGSGHIGDDREVRLEQPPLGAHMLVRLAALVAQRVEDAAETALKEILIHGARSGAWCWARTGGTPGTRDRSSGSDGCASRRRAWLGSAIRRRVTLVAALIDCADLSVTLVAALVDCVDLPVALVAALVDCADLRLTLLTALVDYGNLPVTLVAALVDCSGLYVTLVAA